jgi:hypothetical protein
VKLRGEEHKKYKGFENTLFRKLFGPKRDESRILHNEEIRDLNKTQVGAMGCACSMHWETRMRETFRIGAT